MAHEVESMFYVDEVPWHGLGHAFEEAPSIDDAIVAAGLDWEVGMRPLFVNIPNEDGGSDKIGVPGRATFRKSDNSILGVVGMRYQPLQNIDAFKFFQPFLDAGEAELHTAGSLCDGKRVWILAKIKRDNSIIAKGDEVAKFVMLSHSHDGSLSIQVGFTPIRVVCANTLAMAHSSNGSKLIKVRHTAKAKDNLEDVREIMNAANSTFEATAEQYKLLAKKDIDRKSLRKYVQIVLGFEGVKPRELSTRTKNTIQEITKLFEGGHGNKLPGVRGTYWAAYNAITEHLSYVRGRSKEGRMDQIWFGGASAKMNDTALRTAMQMAV
jgi:phage/plasmid-like protein (TIGR03299 family)